MPRAQSVPPGVDCGTTARPAVPALTGPWGHDGEFTELRAFVDHYSESDNKLRAFTMSHLELLLQNTLLPTAEQILATRDPLLQGVFFASEVVDEVTAFMGALTDPAALDLCRAWCRRPCRADCQWMAASTRPGSAFRLRRKATVGIPAPER